MYIPFADKHIDEILNIRRSAERVCKLSGFENIQELSDVLFDIALLYSFYLDKLKIHEQNDL